MTTELPQPSADAAAASEALCQRIAAEIDAAGGWISFARYMELALYSPGLGYYSGGARKFGVSGDFVTAPELTPIFAQTLARQVAQVMQLSSRQVLEAGGGSGALAADLLLALEKLDCAPESYFILELSGELRARQAETLQRKAPHLAKRVTWLETLPQRFSGCVIGNEVLDAMPVHVLQWREDKVVERGVGLERNRFHWSERPLDATLQKHVDALQVSPPCISEINLAAAAWVAGWGALLEQGALILVDYGFPRHEYYHPQRSSGTLMCHYRHHAHDDPFWWPGLNDITAHVDFTAMAEAGFGAGLDVAGYISQAGFLLNCGLTEVLAVQAQLADAARFNQSRAVDKLISPAEMGELFKVIGFSRGLSAPLIGFAQGDKTHTL